MRLKRVSCIFLMCVTLIGCLTMNAGAINAEETACDISVARASGRFSMDIPGNAFFTADTAFPLEIGETVTINTVYSPRSASVDFGLIAPDGLFYSVGAQRGSLDATIEVNQRGYYTLAIRNNSDVDVSVSGFVTY